MLFTGLADWMHWIVTQSTGISWFDWRIWPKPELRMSTAVTATLAQASAHDRSD